MHRFLPPLHLLLHHSRVLRSCQRPWQHWTRWRRSWSIWNLRDGNWIWRSCTNLRGTCSENPSFTPERPEVLHFFSVKWTGTAACSYRDDAILCALLRWGRSHSVKRGCSPLQLHPAQLLRVLARGAEEDRCHLLAQLPPGEALWWKLCLLLPSLLRLSVCSSQNHQEIPWGKEPKHQQNITNLTSESKNLIFKVFFWYTTYIFF